MRLIIPFIFIGTAILVVFTLAEPLYRSVQELNVRGEQFDDALSRSAELKQIRERLTTKYQNFDPIDRERLTKLLPDNIDNVRLILDVDDIARLHRMRIRDISVTSEDTQNASNGKGNAAAATVKNDYEKVTIMFSTDASYETFLLFLTDLERSLRLVDVSALSMTATEEGDQLSYNVSLVAYWLK